MKKIYELTGWNLDYLKDNDSEHIIDTYPADFLPALVVDNDEIHNSSKVFRILSKTYDSIEFINLNYFNYREMYMIPKFEYDTLIEELEEYKILYKKSLK